MGRRFATGVALALALLTVAAGPAAAEHEQPTKVFETTVGDAPMPTTGIHTDGDGPGGVDIQRVVDSFQIPDDFNYWYATVTKVRLEGGEVDVDKWITVDDPQGGGAVVDGSSSGTGAAVRLCWPVAVSCTVDVGDAQDHWALDNTQVNDGTYEIELRGFTTAEYTVSVYGFETLTPPAD